MSLHRKRNGSLGLPELVAIAVGGMVGGGIFTVLGISVSMVGALMPLSIFLGGIVALLAAYSYVKLGLYYRGEGASFSYIKKTFPHSHFAPSLIGWLVIFGYISTLALYAYTFSSYAISAFAFANNVWIRKALSIVIVGLFAAVNIWSVKGMGKLEDIIVYLKLLILLVISIVLIRYGVANVTSYADALKTDLSHVQPVLLFTVSSITFVAYEGFQLVDNAVDEMDRPEKNISRGIYTAIAIVMGIYLVISVGAMLAIPAADLIQNQEYALAAGAEKVMGGLGSGLVIFGALLATSSAISGTLFGASRQIAVVSENGYMPKLLHKRKGTIPVNGILAMAAMASLLILIGGLDMILEFGSITFLLVSLLMAVSNFKIRKHTHSSPIITGLALILLAMSSVLILSYEFSHALGQMLFILSIYVVLSIVAFIYAKKRGHTDIQSNTSG